MLVKAGFIEMNVLTYNTLFHQPDSLSVSRLLQDRVGEERNWENIENMF